MFRRPVLLCLLVALPLASSLLTGCSGRGLTRVRGTVQGWDGGAGPLEVLSDNLETVAGTTLEASGRFNLDLPGAAALERYLQPSLIPELPSGACTNSVTSSAGGARFYSIGDLSAFPGGNTQKTAVTIFSGESNESSDPRLVTRRVLIYASQPTTVRGDLDCTVGGQRSRAVYNLNLKQGWNYTATRQTIHAAGSSETVISVVGSDGFERWSVAR